MYSQRDRIRKITFVQVFILVWALWFTLMFWGNWKHNEGNMIDSTQTDTQRDTQAQEK